MIRHIESLWMRRLAILLCVPLLLLAPFWCAVESFVEALKAIPHALTNCKDMWSKEFKPCKRI